jgi:Protein of unknown function (DUF433)
LPSGIQPGHSHSSPFACKSLNLGSRLSFVIGSEGDVIVMAAFSTRGGLVVPLPRAPLPRRAHAFAAIFDLSKFGVVLGGRVQQKSRKVIARQDCIGWNGWPWYYTIHLAARLEKPFMPVEVTYPHIEKTEGSPARLRQLPRIRVAQIVIDYLNHGWSAEEICIHYPHLKLAEVHTAMAYYFDHRAEIDAEIDKEQKLIEASRQSAKPTSVELRLRAQGLLPHR